MSDIYNRNTGSALLNEICAKRAAFREKIYSRSPTNVANKNDELLEEVIAPEEPVEPPVEAEMLPKFPFLPRVGERTSGDHSGPAMIRHIQRVVSDYYNISVADMISQHRSRPIARPRMIAIYLCSTLTTRSISDISRRFGGRDHTTALHACRKIKHTLAGTYCQNHNPRPGPPDKDLANEIDILRKIVTP